MKFEEAKVEEVFQEQGLSGIYNAIENAGKICTGSTPKRGEDAIKFVQRMIDSVPQHGRPLEFGTVYMKFNWWNLFKILKYALNPYSRVRKLLYVTTNYRVLVENNWLSDIKKYLHKNNTPSEYHEKRRTLHWTISRVQADSFRTHCSLSSLMQSTRYCNYSKGRFGNHIICILPQWACERYHGENKYEDYIYADTQKKVDTLYENDEKFKLYYDQLESAEKCYFSLINENDPDKLQPQNGRGVLPLDIKTEFIQCGYESDWKHFFYLRVEKGAHPDAQYIASHAQLLLKLN